MFLLVWISSYRKINCPSLCFTNVGECLDKIMASCGFSIVGTDSLVLINHIKRSGYCFQVANCVMFSLLTSARQGSGDKGPLLQ